MRPAAGDLPSALALDRERVAGSVHGAWPAVVWIRVNQADAAASTVISGMSR